MKPLVLNDFLGFVDVPMRPVALQFVQLDLRCIVESKKIVRCGSESSKDVPIPLSTAKNRSVKSIDVDQQALNGRASTALSRF